MARSKTLFPGLFFLTVALTACNPEDPIVDFIPPPSLSFLTIPTRELPANSRLMIVSIPAIRIPLPSALAVSAAK
jgi:hypothetical protein